MRKLVILFFSISSILIAVFLENEKEPQHSAALFIDSKNINQTEFFELGKSIREKFSTSLPPGNYYWTQVGITSHHLPVALDFISDFYKYFLNSDGPRETFIILGPDHLEKCSSLVSLINNPYQTPFGEAEIDMEVAGRLLESGVFLDEKCFLGEHSVAVQAIFIKYLFPNAKIVPLLLSSQISDEAIENIAGVLSEYKDKISVIASVDFSHYHSYDVALKIDSISEEMIENLNISSLGLDYVDSPPSVKLAVLMAKKNNSNRGIIIGKANSFDFTGEKENTTGYINAVFAR